jgi:hypothetical protein
LLFGTIRRNCRVLWHSGGAVCDWEGERVPFHHSPASQKVGSMRFRPVSWPVVSAGVCAMGIGAVGLLFNFFSGDAPSRFMMAACGAIAATGAVGVLVGWFHEPSE